MNDKYKIIVAHAERQHSFYLATALKKSGHLYKYITTIYDRPKSLTNRLKTFLKGNVLKKASGRRTDNLSDDDVIQFNEAINLIITYLARFPAFRDLCRRLRNWNGKVFGERVAKYAIKNKVDAVIMFDGYAYSCFSYIKKNAPEIKCILDVTIMAYPFQRKIFDEIKRLTNDEKLKEENFHLYNDKYLNNYQNEFKLGDYFLAGSKMVKESIKFCGISEKKIAINPYGVDIKRFFSIPRKDLKNPLRIIVVGQLNRRKGIHQLLSVVSKYTKDQVVLDLAGGFESTSDIFLNYKNCENINFKGFVTHDILSKMYQEAHVFALPSFAEGMALAGLEALASGLPLLCSNCTGVNDLIIQYENGIVTRAGNERDIKKGIEWFLNNMDRIPEMSINARKTAENYTWDNYYNNTLRYIECFMNEKESAN